MTADPQEPVRPGGSTRREVEIRVVPQPGIRYFNGDQQTIVTKTNRVTGELESFGNKVIERKITGATMALTCDNERQILWVLIADEQSSTLYQSAYKLDEYEAVFKMFIGADEETVHRELMTSSAASN